jgi:DNA-binding NarL/FixJ family response regulator
MALRIFVADDHEVVRCGICSLIISHSGWEVCGEAGDGREAVEKVSHLKPDIVILDIGMPSLNGLEAARQILHNDPQQKIAILSITDSEQVIHEALKAGANAYISKSDGVKALVAAIEALQENRTYFNSRVGEIVLNGFRNTGKKPPQRASRLRDLTAREREIVHLLAEGKSTKEVAVTLGVSVKTAETHRSNLMRKLGLHCLSELVMYAVRNNIIQVPGEQASGTWGTLRGTNDIGRPSGSHHPS